MGQFGPTAESSDLSGGNLTAGPGLNTFSVISTQHNDDPQDNNKLSMAVTFDAAGTNLTAAIANQAWFTFDLTVGAGVTDLDLTSLTLNAARVAQARLAASVPSPRERISRRSRCRDRRLYPMRAPTTWALPG